MKENKKISIKNNKFYTCILVVVVILIFIAALSNVGTATIGDESAIENTNVDINESNEDTEIENQAESNISEENTTNISEDAIIGGEALTGLSGDEKIDACNEIVFSKEFIIDGKTYKATNVAVENLEENYIFYEIVNVSNESDSDLMFISLNGDIENNLAFSFLTSYYYLLYYNTYGEDLDTEFAPIDVEVMGNVFLLVNKNVDYDFKYSYEISGNTYMFTEVE